MTIRRGLIALRDPSVYLFRVVVNNGRNVVCGFNEGRRHVEGRLERRYIDETQLECPNEDNEIYVYDSNNERNITTVYENYRIRNHFRRFIPSIYSYLFTYQI